MKKNYFGVFVFFLFFSSCIPESYSISINDFWKHMSYQDEQSDRSKLFDEYDNILKKYPCPNSYMLLSRCMTDDQAIIDTLENGLKLYPNSILLKSYLGYKLISDPSIGPDHPRIKRGKELCTQVFRNKKHMMFAAYGYFNYYYNQFNKIDPNNISDLYSNLRDQERYITITLQEAKKENYTSFSNNFNASSNKVKKQIESVSSKINECYGKEGLLRNIEYNRITSMSNMILFDLNVTNSGNCIYSVYARALDEMYGREYEINLNYQYTNGEFIKIK